MSGTRDPEPDEVLMTKILELEIRKIGQVFNFDHQALLLFNEEKGTVIIVARGDDGGRPVAKAFLAEVARFEKELVRVVNIYRKDKIDTTALVRSDLKREEN